VARAARLSRAGVAVLALALWACGSGAGGQQQAAARPYQPGRAIFTFADTEIVESSGFAASSRSDAIFYTHNDSGDRPRFFVVDNRGCTLVRSTVARAAATDWEDMTRGPGRSGESTLWFADIGDNASTRPFVSVYAVAEPPTPRTPGPGPCRTPVSDRVTGSRYDLVYPDGPHDAEALFAHPRTGRLYVVTKAIGGPDVTTVFAAPLPLVSGAKNRLTAIATLTPTVVTGAAMSPDGRSVVVRNYTAAYEWRGVKDDVGAAMRRAPVEVELPAQPQGEAIAYTRDGRGLLISSEEPAPIDPPVYLLRRSP
jgi:hypothetical protein